MSKYPAITDSPAVDHQTPSYPTTATGETEKGYYGDEYDDEYDDYQRHNKGLAISIAGYNLYHFQFTASLLFYVDCDNV